LPFPTYKTVVETINKKCGIKELDGTDQEDLILFIYTYFYKNPYCPVLK
jgi:hypothetical protein